MPATIWTAQPATARRRSIKAHILSSSHPQFATTQWTLVWKAASQAKQDSGQLALDEVVTRYWQPLYAFARRKGFSREDAEDATQEFLSRVVDGCFLDEANPAKGKFRTYLLTVWQRFLIDEYRKMSTAKRGGKVKHYSIDFSEGERAWSTLQSDNKQADHIFLISWANNLLGQVETQLRNEFSGERNQVFETLFPLLTNQLTNDRYEQLASELGLTAGAVKVALHRLRKRYGERLRELVRETLDDEGDVDSELSELLTILTAN